MNHCLFYLVYDVYLLFDDILFLYGVLDTIIKMVEAEVEVVRKDYQIPDKVLVDILVGALGVEDETER